MEGGCHRVSASIPAVINPMKTTQRKHASTRTRKKMQEIEGDRSAWRERGCVEMGVCAFAMVWNRARQRQERVGCDTLPKIQGWAGGIDRDHAVTSVIMSDGADPRVGDWAYLRCSVSHDRMLAGFRRSRRAVTESKNSESVLNSGSSP
jgi:hypothetical protein